MIQRLDIYDIIGALVPGTLLVCIAPICFPQVVFEGAKFDLPEGFEVIALIVLAFFAGNILQSISSLIEPALDWTWGGRASDRALSFGLGDRYLPVDTAKRIKKKLLAKVGDDATDRSLFIFAMKQSSSADAPSVNQFLSHYTYNRGLLILIIMGIILFASSTKWGAAAEWSRPVIVLTLVLSLLLLLLVWFRTKQRAFYYVREVLLIAERTVDA